MLPIVAVLALSTTGCKLKLDAKVTGAKPDEPGTLVVHVVTEKGADLTCAGDACAKTKVPETGEVDLDVKVPSGAKTVLITGKKGLKKKDFVLDVAGGTPPQLVAKDGEVTCIPSGCKVKVNVAPKSEAFIEAAAGAIVEIGGTKTTVPASGSTVVELPSPLIVPLEKQPLSTVCVGISYGSKPSPVLGSTTVAITLPGTAKATTQIDFDAKLVEKQLSRALDEVENGAVVFPWEKAGAPAKGKRAAVYADGDYCYDAAAAGSVVADLDVVALSKSTTREDTCTYHVTDGTIRSGKITMHDEQATAYDRISGRKLGSRTFLAPKDCDKEITIKRTEFSLRDQYGFVNDDGVAKWALMFAR